MSSNKKNGGQNHTHCCHCFQATNDVNVCPNNILGHNYSHEKIHTHHCGNCGNNSNTGIGSCHLGGSGSCGAYGGGGGGGGNGGGGGGGGGIFSGGGGGGPYGGAGGGPLGGGVNGAYTCWKKVGRNFHSDNGGQNGFCGGK
jgi:hypothetical protein